MDEARKTWQEEQKDTEKFPSDRLIFLDESGTNIGMIRRYGRARRKLRVHDYAPKGKPRKTTLISSVRLDGTLAYKYFQGSLDGEKFLEYIKAFLNAIFSINSYIFIRIHFYFHLININEYLK